MTDLCDDGVLVDTVLEAAVVDCELDVFNLDKIALVPIRSHPLVRFSSHLAASTLDINSSIVRNHFDIADSVEPAAPVENRFSDQIVLIFIVILRCQQVSDSQAFRECGYSCNFLVVSFDGRVNPRPVFSFFAIDGFQLRSQATISLDGAHCFRPEFCECIVAHWNYLVFVTFD